MNQLQEQIHYGARLKYRDMDRFEGSLVKIEPEKDPKI